MAPKMTDDSPRYAPMALTANFIPLYRECSSAVPERQSLLIGPDRLPNGCLVLIITHYEMPVMRAPIQIVGHPLAHKRRGTRDGWVSKIHITFRDRGAHIVLGEIG